MVKLKNKKIIKKKWLLIIDCFILLLIIAWGCQSFKLKMIDKVPPVIELYSDTVEITEGDEYNPNDNVKSVKDDIDGEIIRADNNLDEAGKAYYFIDSTKLDTSKVGEYSVKVIARNKAGNEVTKEFTVKVLEKKDDNDSSVSTNNGNNQASNNKENASSFTKDNINSNTNKENNSSKNNNSGTSSNIDNKSEQTCVTVWVQDSAAWDETVVDKETWDEVVYDGTVARCPCGAEFALDDSLGHYNHDIETGHHGWETYEKTHTVHHDAVTHVVHHEAIGHNEQKCN